MKCNSNKVKEQKRKIAKEKAEAERKAMLNAMTDEEREIFLKKEEEERNESVQRGAKHLLNLAALSSIIDGPDK